MVEGDPSLLCMLLVPPHMLPRELVVFLYPFINNLRQVWILRHYVEPSRFLAVIDCLHMAAAKILLSALQGTEFNSFEPTRVLLLPCKQLNFLHDPSHPEPAPGEGGDSVLTCAVCLEPFDAANPQSLVFNCNHMFHFACVRNLEGPTCPVCRFTHDSPDDTHTACQVLISRSGMCALSMCTCTHRCAAQYRRCRTTYGCAWCAALRDAGVAHATTLSITTRPHFIHTPSTQIRARCGTSQVRLSIKSGTLTHSPRCAGDGFVHRLIVHKGEEDSLDAPAVLRHKLVEVPDPHSRSEERPQVICIDCGCACNLFPPAHRAWRRCEGRVR
jgi:hypothetical protein